MSETIGNRAAPLVGEEHILSISELTRQIKTLLEETFPAVWVSGEISNLSRPRSGHCYLTLKDETAQIRAVIWRSAAAKIPFDLLDGLEVVCQGHLDLYPPRGSYQLVIQQIMPKGLGSLELALRQLREKLKKEGLFDEKHKKLPPGIPRRVAFVTSPTGAAIRDFLEVLRRRWRGVDVLIVPVRVQGNTAAQEIATALDELNRMADPVDAIVVGRGGGSLEDLWAFNEEPLVRAIFASKIPVISAVGHEIDVTLSDLVADVRALTPSEAAERIAPSSVDMENRLLQYQRRLNTAVMARLEFSRSHLDSLASRRVFHRPLDTIRQLERTLDELADRIQLAMRHSLESSSQRLSASATHLESLSPLGVLSRGYSITQRVGREQVIRNAEKLEVGESMQTLFHHGSVTSRIESISLKPAIQGDHFGDE